MHLLDALGHQCKDAAQSAQYPPGRSLCDAGRPRGHRIPQRAADRRADRDQPVLPAREDAGELRLDEAREVHAARVVRRDEARGGAHRPHPLPGRTAELPAALPRPGGADRHRDDHRVQATPSAAVDRRALPRGPQLDPHRGEARELRCHHVAPQGAGRVDDAAGHHPGPAPRGARRHRPRALRSWPHPHRRLRPWRRR